MAGEQGSGERARAASQASLRSIGVNIALTVLRAVTALLSGSTAVLADTLNSGADIFASLVSLGATRVAERPPDEDHPYGHEKAETVAAKIVALVLIFTGVSTGYAAIGALRTVTAPPGILAVWVSGLAIIVKELLARYLLRAGRRLNHAGLTADGHNQRSDVLASGAALVGVVGARLGYPILDPLAGLVVAGLILRLGVKIYWQSIRELMDLAPDRQILQRLQDLVESVPGVAAVTDLKARLHGPQMHVDTKIAVPYSLTVWEGHQIARRVVAAVHGEFPDVKAVLVHVNPYGEPAGAVLPPEREAEERPLYH